MDLGIASGRSCDTWLAPCDLSHCLATPGLRGDKISAINTGTARHYGHQSGLHPPLFRQSFIILIVKNTLLFSNSVTRNGAQLVGS